jgi:hypothetical protein
MNHGFKENSRSGNKLICICNVISTHKNVKTTLQEEVNETTVQYFGGGFGPPRTEDILPRWFPTNGDGKQQVWFSECKFSDVEKSRLIEDTQASTKRDSASFPSVNANTYYYSIGTAFDD